MEIKNKSFLLFALTFLFCGQMFANANRFYAELTAEVGEGEGRVYVGTDSIKPTSYDKTSTNSFDGTSSKTNDTFAKVKFYLFAQPYYGYKISKCVLTPDTTVEIYNSNFTQFLPAEVYVKAISSDKKNPTLGNVTVNFESYNKTYSVEYMKTEGLSNYKVVGPVGYPSVTPGKIVPTHDNYELQITANPLDGYNLYRWFIINSQGEKEYLDNLESTITMSFSDNTKIGAEFKAGCFRVDNDFFTDIDEAFEAAKVSSSKVVSVISDYTLEGTHVVPAGVTLLVPFDGDNTCYLKSPECTISRNTPKVYKSLTLSKDASLIVNGNISVSAKIAAGNGGENCCGAVSGPYGHIQMNEGSSIVLKDASNLYAWGYISGKGNVIAESGSCVYENFQFTDFRGGKVSFDMAGNAEKVFPLSQYYIQNIEAPLTLLYGAKEKLYSSVAVESKPYSTTATLVCTEEDLETEKESMFVMSSGTITKYYDPLTDRIKYVLDGANAEIGSISVTLSNSSTKATVSSVDYVLPITNNMSVELKNGSKLSLDNDAAMYAGSELVVEKGSEFIIGVKKTPSFYVYDHDEWVSDKYAFQECFKPVAYTHSKKYARTIDDLFDSRIDLNGVMTINGSIYTTKGGANITSTSGSGSIQFNNNIGKETNTYQFTQVYLVSGTNIPTTKYVPIPITPACLLNADGNYVSTSIVQPTESFYYDNGIWHHCKRVGDVNMDGRVDIKDIVALVNIINGKTNDTFGKADVNEDGNINAEDVNKLEKIILWK